MAITCCINYPDTTQTSQFQAFHEMGVSRTSKKPRNRRTKHATAHQQPHMPTKKQIRAANREQNLGARVTIPINVHGSRIWLPGGFNTTLPSSSVIKLPRGGLVSAVDNESIDLIHHGRLIHSAAPHARVVLHGSAIVTTPSEQPIQLARGISTTSLDLPPGTLLQFGADNRDQRIFTLGTRIFDWQVTLRDYLLVEGESPMTLSAPVTLGSAGMTLEQDTEFPHPLLLTGTTVIEGWTALPGNIILDEPGPVQVLIHGAQQGQYIPERDLHHGTVLPCATLLPRGTRLNKGTVIPGGTTLPAGTVLGQSTFLPRGTILPAGSIVPPGTSLPHHVDPFLKTLEAQNGDQCRLDDVAG